MNQNNDPSQPQSTQEQGSTQSQRPKRDRLFQSSGPTAAESANDRARRASEESQTASSGPDGAIEEEQRDRQGRTPGSQADGEP